MTSPKKKKCSSFLLIKKKKNQPNQNPLLENTRSSMIIRTKKELKFVY